MEGGEHKLIHVAPGAAVILYLPALGSWSALAFVWLRSGITFAFGLFTQDQRTKRSPSNPRDMSFGALVVRKDNGLRVVRMTLHLDRLTRNVSQKPITR